MLFELTGVGVVQTDLATGRFVRANASFCEMVGYREDELRGMTYLELTHPEDRVRDAASFAALERGESRSGTSLTRCVRKDGQVVWLELHVTVVGEGDEAVNFTVASDVTERHQAEQRVRESEETFRAFVQTTSDIVYEMSADWLEMRSLVGKEFIATTDAPRSNWLAAYIPDDEKTRVWAAIREAIEAKRTFALEHRVLRLDGTEGWTFSRAVPLLDEQGEIVRWLGAASDITERKRREQQQDFLLRLSDLLRPLADAAEVQAAVTRTALAHFGADRCYYCELEGEDAIIRRDATREPLPSVAGVYPLSRFALFKTAVDAGRPVVVHNVQTAESVDEDLRHLCLQLQVVSFIDVPVIKDGKPVGLLCLVQSAPRAWTELEVDLVVETAERTWAAVARARAEEKLRASEERLRLAAEAAEIGTWELDLRSNKSPVRTPQHDKLFGYKEPLDEWSFEIFLNHVHPDDRARVKQLFEGAFETGAWAFECRITAADDALRWIAAQGTFYYDKEEKPVRAVGIVLDITERKRREANLAFLAEVSQDLVRLTDIEETMNALGTKIGQFFGVKQCVFADYDDEFRAATVAYGWHAEDARDLKGIYPTPDFLSDELLAALSSGEPYPVSDTQSDTSVNAESFKALGIRSFITAPLVRDGEWRFQISINDDKPREWRSDETDLMRELTTRIWTRLERARAEAALSDLNETLEQRVAERTEELRRSERRFIQAFNAGPVATCITTLDRESRKETFLEVNESFSQLTGYAAEEAVGRTAHDLGMWSSPEDQRKLRVSFDGTTGFRDLELQLRTKAGDTKTILLSGEIIRLDGHHGQLKLFYDVTEQKRSEEQLYRAIQEVMSDTAWFSRQVLERLAQIRSGHPEAKPSVELTQRERQVLALLAQGKSNEAISSELSLATQTVRNYISVVYDKLGVHSRAEAVVWARERGIS